MTIKIAEDEYEYTRPPLKKWLALEDIRAKLHKAVEAHETNNVGNYLISVVSTALSISEEDIKERPWYEIAIAYLTIAFTDMPKYEFPFLRTKVDDRKEIWDYEGRTWYVWSHMLAGKYGWELDVIENLDVDDAIALAQEIAIDEQLQREWEWMRTEIAYQAKDGFKPLKRPDWMLHSKAEPIKTFKIRKDLMPSGIIIRDQASANK